ncbi:beta-defensin 19-like protein [Cricetulus griseus]|nr:beta-defensin 19-like protein [Cricetulus griseus]
MEPKALEHRKVLEKSGCLPQQMQQGGEALHLVQLQQIVLREAQEGPQQLLCVHSRHREGDGLEFNSGDCRSNPIARCHLHPHTATMKLFLLLLAIFVATELVISGKSPVLHCLSNRGFCRSSCKKDEQPYFYCRNFQTCCLQSYVRISLTGIDEDTNWSYDKHWPKIPVWNAAG